MNILSIDIETFSSNDLIKSGVYKYVEAPDFAILLFGYAFDDEPVQIVDLISEKLPDVVLKALTNPAFIKTAHNANFERTCIRKFFNIDLPVQQWECTMVRVSMLGLPLSLDAASKALKLKTEKSTDGKTLIRYFSIPCKPTKTNGGRTRNMPENDPEKWQKFKDYCIQDVVVEREIRNKVSFFEPPPFEKTLWNIDQEINDTGVLLDPKFVKNAIWMDTAYREKLTTEAIEITGIQNPNSASQLKQWLTEETDINVTSLTKEAVPVLLQNIKDNTVKRVLNIRQEMAKTSVKKYAAMVSAVCNDHRVRGLLQFYGANRTGRWAGRLVQVQNLPQNHLPDLDLARSLVKEGDLEMLDLLYGNVPDTLSQLIRTSFIASPRHRFIVADFSAIEARVIAWLANEKWRLDVFSTHGKIYEASAAHMFKVPVEDVTKGSHLRQKAKIAELALGYGGGPNALLKMGALKMGLQEEELPQLVAMWRNSNKKIVDYWTKVEEAAMDTVREGIKSVIHPSISFYISKGVLFIKLPGGRCLTYLKPQIRPNKFNGESIVYEGLNHTTKQWGKQETYGGKLVENLCQAIARDCLADAMIRLHNKGYKIVMHVHDEVVLEMPEGKGSTEEVDAIMSEPIPWAKGLPLKAESYETFYYKKD
jgi:DNA polymerase